MRLALGAAALTLLFLASWIYLPAPNRTLLTLAVGAPEVAVWLVLAGVVVTALALVTTRGALRSATIAMSATATMAALMPLARLPFAVRRFDRTITTVLGDDYLHRVPADRLAAMRPSPFSMREFVFGLDRGDVLVVRALPVAAPAGARLTLDLYQPQSGGLHPVVVQIYGGAWQRGEPEDDAVFARYLAAHDFVVFAIDYRHAPAWKWPTQRDDVRAALDWIRQHGREHGADVTRIALIGRSAGAQLAMLAAYESTSRRGAASDAALPPPIAAVVSYYGPVDLAHGYRYPPRPDPLNVRAIDEAFLGGTPDQVPEQYRDASPLNHVSARLPPSLLIYGGRDHIVQARYGAQLDARLRAAGSTSVFLEIPWAEHAFDAVQSGTSAQLALYYTERFLAWALTR